MAKLKTILAVNLGTPFVSGKVNQFVYSHRYDQIIVSKPPVRNADFTEGEIKNQNKFGNANVYAKSAIAYDSSKYAYSLKAKRGRSAYHVAFADYYKVPEIKSVEITGQLIRAVVIDDFKVASVRVKIVDVNGNVIEEGDAVRIAVVPISYCFPKCRKDRKHPKGLCDVDKESWEYTSTVVGALASGHKISVTAIDLPGNAVVEQKVI